MKRMKRVDTREGKAAGRKWAENKATYDELLIVEGLKFEAGTPYCEQIKFVDFELVRMIPATSPVPSPPVSDTYVAAFVKGAIEVYEELRDRPDPAMDEE